MNSPGVKDPGLLARSAQCAIVAAALLGPFRAVTYRAHHLNPTSETLRQSGLVSMVFVYMYTAAAVLFLLWFNRCRRNAYVFSRGAFPWRSGWIAVVWLVPVITWVLPGRILLDIHRASAGEAADRRGAGLVKAWWAAWAGYGVVAGVGSLAGGWDSPAFIVLSQILNIAAAVLAVLVVQRVTTLQRTKARTAPTVELLGQA